MFRFLRYLRIAFSVVCGIACVLLVMLCVRSYHRDAKGQAKGERLTHVDSQRRLYVVHSRLGAVHLSAASFDSGVGMGWNVDFAESRALGFGMLAKGFSTDLRIPYWFPITLATIATSLPWVRWRFSLRTLLIVTTLIAVVLGAVIYAMR